MNLQDIQFLTPYKLPAGQSLYRVQRKTATPETIRRGPLKLAPLGMGVGRFDLTATPCAYLAESPETSLYESVFRREATGVSLTRLAQQELLTVQITQEIDVGDLRPHAPSWPVLQSLRYSETRELAEAAFAAGYRGLFYRSAQQFGQDCIVWFDPPAGAVKVLSRTTLVNESGALSRWAFDAARRSRVPLVP